MKKFKTLIICLIAFPGFSQFTIIPTETDDLLHEIVFTGSEYVIVGRDGFFGKCNSDCSELAIGTAPGYFGYYRSNFNVIDTNLFYLASYRVSPYHLNIFKSSNAGETWEVMIDTSGFFFKAFFMFDENNASLNGGLYQSVFTTNGGITWEGTFNGLLTCNAYLKINDSTAVMGTLEDFSITKNKGETWYGGGFPQSPPTEFFAFGAETLFAITYGAGRTYLTYSYNPPEAAWAKKNIPDLMPFGIYVKEMDEIYVVGKIKSTDNAGILKTSDLGETWSYYDTGIEGTFYAIDFINDTTALIAGTNGLLIKWSTSSHFETVGLESYDETNFSSRIMVYPNPSNNMHTLSLNLHENCKCSILLSDVNGKIINVVYDGNLNSGENKIDVNLEELRSGTYFYTIIKEETGDVIQKKWIKY